MIEKPHMAVAQQHKNLCLFSIPSVRRLYSFYGPLVCLSFGQAQASPPTLMAAKKAKGLQLC